jgi:phage gpG-like protein
VTPAEYSDKLRQAREKLPAAMLAECGRLAQAGLGMARRRLTGEVLHYRTGALRRSVEGDARVGDNGWRIELRAGGGRDGVRYARIHEEGGIIRAKRGFLAIPLPPVLNARGVAKGPPRSFKLSFVPIHGGAAGLLVKPMGRGKRRSFLAYFYLTRQVRIPRRPYLVPSRDELAEIVPARLQGVLSRLVSG